MKRGALADIACDSDQLVLAAGHWATTTDPFSSKVKLYWDGKWTESLKVMITLLRNLCRVGVLFLNLYPSTENYFRVLQALQIDGWLPGQGSVV